jgi:hypothetical protein
MKPHVEHGVLRDPKRPGRSGESGSREEARQIKPGRSVAGVHVADVAAEGVVLANPAAAIAVGRIRRGGGDRAADDGGADEARANAPAGMEAMASAAVVVEAMLPVAAMAATARAAILVLIDMDNSIRLLAEPLWPAYARLDGGISASVRNLGVKFW